MSTRTAHASAITASKAETFRWGVLVRLDFAGGVVAVHSGVGPIDYDGDTYLGVGNLGSLSPVREGIEPRPYQVTAQLSGIPSEYIAIALGENYQGRDAKIYDVLLDSDHQIIGTPTLAFNGRMDTMDVLLGAEAVITVTMQSRLADWDRARVRRYNHEDQIAEYPNDKGFEFVAQMVEKELLWGRKFEQ